MFSITKARQVFIIGHTGRRFVSTDVYHSKTPIRYAFTPETPNKPITNRNFRRLYGHMLCPFVEKTRLALAAKDIDYQDCQVDMSSKAPWHMEMSKGLIPLLEFPDGQMLVESSVIQDYADDASHSGFDLYPTDAFKHAKYKLVLDQFQKMLPDLFAMWRSRGQD